MWSWMLALGVSHKLKSVVRVIISQHFRTQRVSSMMYSHFCTQCGFFFQVKHGGIIVEVRITVNRRLSNSVHIPGALALLLYFHHSQRRTMEVLRFHLSR